MLYCDWSVIARLMRRLSLTRSHHAMAVGPIRFSNRSNNCRVGKINRRRSSLVRSHHAIFVFSSSLRPTKDENRMVWAGLYTLDMKYCLWSLDGSTENIERTVEPLSNDHPHQRPSVLYGHISCDGQCFLFVRSLTDDHPSNATSDRVRWNFLPRGRPHRIFQSDGGMNVRWRAAHLTYHFNRWQCKNEHKNIAYRRVQKWLMTRPSNLVCSERPNEHDWTKA